MKNGLAAAKARGKKIGRERKRNDALIHSLLQAGLSFREIAKIAKCSHGSVSASKKEWLGKKNNEAFTPPLMLPANIEELRDVTTNGEQEGSKA